MILMREITPGTMRRGTVVESASTPSTRKRTCMSRSAGSKWMSEAPRSMASPTMECTSLMTGASSVSRSVISSSSTSSSAASAIAESRRLMRVTTARMSSREATTGRTSSPVMIATSSMASTLAGSAIASISVPWLMKPIGMAS